MKHRFYAVCLVGFAIALLSYRVFENASRANNFHETRFSTGTRDAPNARVLFENMRLRDPATEKIPPGIRRKELRFATSLPRRSAAAVLSSNPSSAGGQETGAPLHWQTRGPVNIGGRTRALAYDISNPKTILAGGVSGGMWRTTDSGKNWRRTTEAHQLQAVTAVVQDVRPGKTHIWYAGTGERKGNSASAGGAAFRGDGILKSTDGGRSWQLLASTSTGRPQRLDNFFDYVWSLAADPTNSEQDEVYVATHNTVYRSENGGESWQIALGERSRTTIFVDVAVSPSGGVYAALSSGGAVSGIWRSATGKPGDWIEITPEGWPPAFNRIVIGIAPVADELVYFMAETPWRGALGHALWRYHSGQWQDLTDNLPAFGGAVGDYESQNSYDMLVKIMPGNPDVVFLGGTNLYRSTDGFTTASNTSWIGGYSQANDVSMMKGHHPDQHALAFHPKNPMTVLSGHDGGVSVTYDALASAVVWESLNNGYVTTQFYTIALDSRTPGSNLILGGMQDNGTWRNGDSQNPGRWQSLFGGDGGFCAVGSSASECYVSVQLGSVFRLQLDELGKRVSLANVTPAQAAGFLFINPFVLDSNDPRVMYLVAGNSVWRNHDLSQIPESNGETTINWRRLANLAEETKITAVAISTAPANRLYFGVNQGQVYRIEDARTDQPEIHLIADHGELPEAYINCLAIDPENGSRLLVVFSNYNVPSLFYSEDSGDSWQNVSGNLEQFPDGSGSGPSTRWAKIVPDSGKVHYFVGASTGLYSTTKLAGQATMWLQEGASTIGNVVVDMIDARVSDQTVVVATHGRGVFSAKLTDRSNVEFGSFSVAMRTGRLRTLLKWRTTYETDTREFRIERKNDLDNSWASVGAVAGTGASTGQSYSFVDDIAAAAMNGVAILSYRLRHITTAGKEQLSQQKTTPIRLPPVQLVRFDRKLTADGLAVVLAWETSLEFRSDAFLVERSFGPAKEAWSAIAAISGQGATDETSQYQVIDPIRDLRQSRNSILRYRLKHATTTGDTTLIAETKIELPGLVLDFALHQNYPNPFNPSTRIAYQLPVQSRVLLEIFNPAGQKVATLVNKSQGAGHHQAIWDASQQALASGVYFYRLRIVSLEKPEMRRTAVRKLLLAK